MTWVVSDYTGAAGSRELTVHKGQQVEILEVSGNNPEMCLVRLLVSGGDTVQPEGLVPISVLKQLPHTRLRSSGEQENGKSNSKILLL